MSIAISTVCDIRFGAEICGASSTADLCSDPNITYPSDLESADPPAPTHIFTFTHSGAAETLRIPLVSFSYGPFRVWRTLGEGGYATSIGVQDIASNRLLCLKVFQKDRFKYMFTEEILLISRIGEARTRNENKD